MDVLRDEVATKKNRANQIDSEIRDFQGQRRMAFYAATTPRYYQRSVPLYAIFNHPI